MNPVSTIRLVSNIAIVAVMIIFAGAVLFGFGASPIWVWIIGAVAVGGALAQFTVSIIWPNAIKPAWDEQVVATHKASYQFGYWVLLIVFIGFFVLTQLDLLSYKAAFLWLGPFLAAAPSVWMIGGTLAGRAG